MTIPFLDNLDMNLGQIFNFLAQLLASDPVSPSEAQIWYDSTNHVLKYRNNTLTIALYNEVSTNTASTVVLRDSSGNFAANIGTFNSITINNTPSANTDAATVAYVQSTVQGISNKYSVTVATTAALAANTYNNGSFGVGATLTGNSNGALAAIDGYTPVVSDTILVKNETASANNGYYTVTQLGDASHPYILTRMTDADTSSKILGSFTFVENGTTNAQTGWVNSNTSAITMGTTGITFIQFTSVGEITVNNPLSKSGNTISLTLSARLINNGSNQLDLASIVTAGTGTSITYDAFGRVTASADITSGTGIVTKTSSGTFTARTITGTSNVITVTNGDGVAGNPTITIAATYAGQTSITTLGTITTGTWNGTTIAVANGGTGATTAAGARTNLGTVGKFAGTITGDGSTTSFTVTHNLGTQDVIVQVQDSSQNVVLTGVQANTTNTCIIKFATAPAVSVTYRVIVTG